MEKNRRAEYFLPLGLVTVGEGVRKEGIGG
jgi:hypothetical protein